MTLPCAGILNLLSPQKGHTVKSILEEVEGLAPAQPKQVMQWVMLLTQRSVIFAVACASVMGASADSRNA